MRIKGAVAEQTNPALLFLPQGNRSSIRNKPKIIHGLSNPVISSLRNSFLLPVVIYDRGNNLPRCAGFLGKF